ncbi:MAG TPA: N-acetyl-gamma-glutamyl-phosphate reductase [Candidatus Rubrimentiphilum sp.]|nr:N-acetyl-gamma-glutamyl-phosphate reductase [Candidatus Rubrimentiphilum sp.]
MTRVHVWGASGYAASETIALLMAHPFVELGALESSSGAGESVGSQFPRLRKLEREFDPPGAVLESLQTGDVVIMGGPHGAAKQVAPDFLAAGARVIDLSDDFRLAPTPAVYGFPERYRAQIADAQLVANPGCYPTATLLAILPVLGHAGVAQIIVDAKSGITGAGRKPAVSSLYAEVANEIRAYGLTGHRHEPEMLQEFRAAGTDAPLVFTPHVVPIVRGLLADVYCVMSKPVDRAAIDAAFAKTYDGNRFVRVLGEDEEPSVAAVAGTNDAEVAVSVRGNVVRSICAIDNLGRGAAGQAVMNLNIMLGYPEESALDARAIAY